MELWQALITANDERGGKQSDMNKRTLSRTGFIIDMIMIP